MNKGVLDLLYGEESLYPVYLEQRHPHILEKIVHLWHTPQMESFFLELMVNSRSDRHGFSHEVAGELYYLSKVYDGTRNLPRTFDENPLAQLGNNPVKNGNFVHSPQDFINMRAPSDDTPWSHIGPDLRSEIERLGYSCTPSGFLKASAAKDLKAIGAFLRCNINIDTCDERGWSPLFFAAFNGSAEFAKLFIEFGANVNLKDHGGFAPLHWAAFKGHANIIKHLIIHNADINAHSLHGITPLMMSAMNGHLAACTALIASGAETDTVSSQGWSALQKACLNRHVPVIRLFLSLLKDHFQYSRPKADKDDDQPAQPNDGSLELGGGNTPASREP